MSNSWVDLLDIIGLEPKTRERAQLETLIDFPLGEPKGELLLNLFEHIIRIFGSESCTMLWWYDPFYPGLHYNIKNTKQPKTRAINKNDLPFLQDLWEGMAGVYILFLPKDSETIADTEDEEEAIGIYLAKHTHLLLKTPDANEVLYLYLKE